MKILVTGSNGLLGQKLIKLCQERGIEVIATSRGESRFDLVSPYFPMDITRLAEVNEVVEITRPDVIINTAAMTIVDQCEDEKEDCIRINVDAVQNLVKVCSSQKIFLLHLSTDFIFDGTFGPLDEEAVPNPVNFYGETKLESEQIIQSGSMDWAIVRTILVYGVVPKMSRSNIILWVKSKLEKGEKIQVVDDQTRTPTLAEDLAEGCLLIASRKKQGIWNISGKDLLTPYQMAVKTAEYFGLDANLIEKTDSTKFRQRAARPLRTGFKLDKAIKELGYNPHSFEEGIGIVANQISEGKN